MADCLMKEMKMPASMENVLIKNVLSLQEPSLNEIRNVNGELRMCNIRNRSNVDVVGAED